MLGELKEVKYFKKITNFQGLIMKNTLKKENAEAYLEPNQRSTMEVFVNILKGLVFSQ